MHSCTSMAFKKTLAQRLNTISKISTSTLTNCRISPPSFKSLMPLNYSIPSSPDPPEGNFFRRFLQKRAMFNPAIRHEMRTPPIGDSLVQKLKTMDIAKDRIRLDCLIPPIEKSEKITVEDARKLLWISQLERLKSNLRDLHKAWISHDEFVQICVEGSSTSDGLDVAKILDDSGTVIVFGNSVCIKPQQVLKAIEGLISSHTVVTQCPEGDEMRQELEEMEKQKATIELKAEKLVRNELWCGLGFLVVQTIGFMRLTFWELSWDVMEPICFYVTSAYFIGGYTFFLRTSREPSFEGFFRSRIGAKEKRLMKVHGFDLERYGKLCKACGKVSGFKGSGNMQFGNSHS